MNGGVNSTDLPEAIARLRREFPFPGYVDGVVDAARTLAEVATRHLPRGARVLDFGCGPCDKTAVLQYLGFACTGCDDLQDNWHRAPGVEESILAFARASGVDFRKTDGGLPDLSPGAYDMVTVCDVIEHLHESPRGLLITLIQSLRPGGILVVTVPNAVNIRKRFAVFVGGTNLPPFDSFYWYPGTWRGHVREYVRDDLARLSRYLGLESLELRGVHHMLSVLPRSLRTPFRLATLPFPGWRDSWLLVARRPADWAPMSPPADADGAFATMPGAE